MYYDISDQINELRSFVSRERGFEPFIPEWVNDMILDIVLRFGVDAGRCSLHDLESVVLSVCNRWNQADELHVLIDLVCDDVCDDRDDDLIEWSSSEWGQVMVPVDCSDPSKIALYQRIYFMEVCLCVIDHINRQAGVGSGVRG